MAKWAKVRESKEVIADRERRMAWWRDGRFGMFVHWGLYSQIGRNEWVQNREKIPNAEYAALADTFKPKKGFAREWVRLAKKAGMKYIVLTTKHCEGFCLWDTKLTDFCATARGPKRDLVAEYVQACREEGMKIGFYYCFMDWHHPDGDACEHDPAAARRYRAYIHASIRELMTNYGKIDIMWYDGAWPLDTPEKLHSRKLNAMVRSLQPDILINTRSLLPEDFDTPEGHITASSGGRSWEACMTFNGDWGYSKYTPSEDWLSVRKVLDMLRQVTLGGGNLLLNIGPEADGSVSKEAVERLVPIGKWLAANGEAVYGRRDVPPGKNLEWLCVGRWTRKGNVGYLWVDRWPGGEDISLACFQNKVKRVSYVATGKPIDFHVDGERVLLTHLPKESPDKIAQLTVIKVEFDSEPHQWCGMGRAAF